MLNVYTQFVQVTNSSHKFSFKLKSSEWQIEKMGEWAFCEFPRPAASRQRESAARQTSQAIWNWAALHQRTNQSVFVFQFPPHQIYGKPSPETSFLSTHMIFLNNLISSLSHPLKILLLWSCIIDDFALQPTLISFRMTKMFPCLIFLRNLSELSRFLGKHSSLPGDRVLLASS